MIVHFKTREKATLCISQASVLNDINKAEASAAQNITTDGGRLKTKREREEQFQKALRTHVNDVTLHKQAESDLDQAPDHKAQPCAVPQKPEWAQEQSPPAKSIAHENRPLESGRLIGSFLHMHRIDAHPCEALWP